MFDEDEIKFDIVNILFEKGLIDERLFEKCNKPHISSLPYDLRTNDSDKLDKRKTILQDRINESKVNIKKLRDDEKKSKQKLDEWGEILQKDIGKIDDNLRILFEDNFGELGTDEPEMDTYDMINGGSKRAGKARAKMMNEWYKLYDDFQKVNTKLSTAITKRKNRKSIDRLLNSFNKKMIRFNKKYDKYINDYGTGYYMDTVTRGFSDYPASKIAYRDLKASLRNNDGEFNISKIYGKYHDDWTNIKNDLKNERNILKDYNEELKKLN